jgi:hypothetical protein
MLKPTPSAAFSGAGGRRKYFLPLFTFIYLYLPLFASSWQDPAGTSGPPAATASMEPIELLRHFFVSGCF